MSEHGFDSRVRPLAVCKALLAALEAAEGRRRSRKRDQTPDAFGLAIKRALLERAVREDPPPERFEQWLLDYPATCASPELVGPARAMARAVFEDWQLAHVSPEFRQWLADGAPSADANAGAGGPEPGRRPGASPP
jgi:hypothetical protein